MEKNLIFSQERNISSAFIDSSLKMGIAQTVLMIQDNLTECFNKLDCDGVIYRERYNAFWVFTKSKIHFEKRPTWRQKIDASTFPIDNAGFKTHVNTVLRDKDGSVLIADPNIVVLGEGCQLLLLQEDDDRVIPSEEKTISYTPPISGTSR